MSETYSRPVAQQPTKPFEPGDRVTASKYDGDWVLREIDSVNGVARIRGLARPPPMEGYFGTYDVVGPGYLQISVPIGDIRHSTSTGPPPGVVTQLEATRDSFGAYKRAVVNGELFATLSGASDSWEQFLEKIQQRGFIIPPSVVVLVKEPQDGLDVGPYTLEQALKLAKPPVEVMESPSPT